MVNKMLAQKIIKLIKSEKIEKIEKLSIETSNLLDKNRDDYTECIEMFPKIFKKLASRRKITDVSLTSSDKRRVVLHQFGLFLGGGEWSRRARRISTHDLFKFLRENELEVFDKVAEEIRYKNTRVAFRDYCRIVSLFLKDNGIEEMVNKRYFDVKMKCRRKFIDVGTGKTERIDRMGITARYANITFFINGGNEIELSRASNIENLVIVEQFQNEIVRGLEKIIKMIRESNDRIGSQELYKRLNDRFSAYLVANQI
jgi:hypothetical protein